MNEQRCELCAANGIESAADWPESIWLHRAFATTECREVAICDECARQGAHDEFDVACPQCMDGIDRPAFTTVAIERCGEYAARWLMEDIGRFARTMRALRKLGVRIHEDASLRVGEGDDALRIARWTVPDTKFLCIVLEFDF